MSQFGSSIPEDQFDTTQDQQFPDTYAMAPDQTASMEASSYSPINEPDQNSVAPTPTYEDIAALENVQVPDVASGNYIPGMRPQSQIDEMNQSRYAPAPQDRWMGDSFDQLNDPQGMYPWESAPEPPPEPTFEQQFGRPPSTNQMRARMRYSDEMQGVSQSTLLGVPIGLYRNDESTATVIERDNVARGLREGNDVLLRDYIAQGKTVVPRGVVSNLAKAVWQGYEQVSAGMNSVIVGIPAATIAAFTGSEVASDTAKLAFAYAKYLDNDVKYNGAKGGSDFEQYVLDVATGLPQIAFQTAAAFISAPFGLSNVAYALSGAGFAGGAQLNDSYQTYKDAGLSETDAYKAALYDSMAAATSTAVTEFIAGKVIGLDKLPTARMAMNMTAAKAFVKGAGRGGLAEATQESLDQFGSDFIINLHRLDMEEFKDFYKQNPDWVKQTLKNAAYAGLVALPLGAIPGALVGVQNFQASARLTESVNLRVKTLPEDHPIRKMVEQDEMSVEDASTVIEWLADKEAKTRVQERADVQYRRMVGNALDFSEISDDQLKTIILMGADGTTARIAGTAEDAGAGANLNFAIHPEMAADELVRRGVIDGSLQASTPVTNAGQGTLTGLSSEEVDSFVADNPEIARELAVQEAPISRKQMERLFGKPFAGNSEAARAAFKENLLSVMRDESGTVRRVEENRARKAKQAGRTAIQSLTGLSGADLERVALGLAPENVMLLNEEKAKTRQEALAGGTLALKEIANRRERSSMTEANVFYGGANIRGGVAGPRELEIARGNERAAAERVKVTVARISLEDASQRFIDAFRDFADSVTDTFSGNTDLAMIAWQAYLVVNQIQTDSGLELDRTFARFGGIDPSGVDAFNAIVADITRDDNARINALERARVDTTQIIEESKLRAALAIAMEDSDIISDPAHVVSRPNAVMDLLGLSRIDGEPDTELDDETIKDVAVVIESGSALGVELRGVVDNNPALADLVDAVDVETIQSLEAEGNHEARLLAKIDNIRRGLDPVTSEGTPSKEQVANAIRAAVIGEQTAAAKVMNDLLQQRAVLEKERTALEGASRFYPDGRPRGVRSKKTDAEKKLEEDIKALDLKIGAQRLVTEEISGRLGQTSEGVHIPPQNVEQTETFPSASAEVRLQTILSARNQIAAENAVDATDIEMRWDDGETVVTTQERYLIEFGNKLGVTVVFVKANRPIRTNGAQKDGVVFVNSALSNNPASMWAVAIHETIHAIAKTSPERFNDLLRLLRAKAPRALRIQSNRWFRLRAEQIKKKAPVAAASKLVDELIAEEADIVSPESQLRQFLWFVRNGTGEDLDILRSNLPANLADALNKQGLFESTTEQAAGISKRWKSLISAMKAADKPSQQTLAEEEVAGVATMLMDSAFFSFVDENGKPDYDKLERLSNTPRASKTLAGITSVVFDIITALGIPMKSRWINQAQADAARKLADGKLAELASPKRREMIASLFAKSLLQMMEIRKGNVDVGDLKAKPLTQTQINDEIPPLDDSAEDGGIGPKRPVRPRKPTGGKGKDVKPTPAKKPAKVSAEEPTDVADEEVDEEPAPAEEEDQVSDEPWMDTEEENQPEEKPKKTKAESKPTKKSGAPDFKPTVEAKQTPTKKSKKSGLISRVRNAALTTDEIKELFKGKKTITTQEFNTKYLLASSNDLLVAVVDFTTGNLGNLSEKELAVLKDEKLTLKAAKAFNDYLDKNSIFDNNGAIRYISIADRDIRGTTSSGAEGVLGWSDTFAADKIGIPVATFNNLKKNLYPDSTVNFIREIRGVSKLNINNRINGTPSEEFGIDAIDQSLSGDDGTIETAISLVDQNSDESFSSIKEFFQGRWPSLLRQTGMLQNKTKAGFEQAAENAVSDVAEFAKKNPRFAKYYESDWKATRKILDKQYGRKFTDEKFLLYRFFAGVTSPNTLLKNNIADSVNLMDWWIKNGNFDAIKMGPKPGTGNLVIKSSPFQISGTTQANKARVVKIFEQLIKKRGSIEKAVKYLQEPISVSDLHDFNRKMGYKGQVGSIGDVRRVVMAATGQDLLIPRMFIFGPKIGAYTLNALGDSNFTTIDIWESRFIRSYFTGMFFKNAGLPQSVQEHEVFTRFGELFNEEFERRTGKKWKPSALQAMRWFYIIDAATKAGYNKGSTNETISYYTRQRLRDAYGYGATSPRSGGVSNAAAAGRGAGRSATSSVIDQSISPDDGIITDKKLRLATQQARFLQSVVQIKPTDPRWDRARPTGQFPTLNNQGKPKYDGEVTQPNLAEVIPAGRNVFHETGLNNAKQLIAKITQGIRNHTPFYVSDNIDLALGQSGKGYIIELDPNLVNGIKADAKNLEFSESMGLGGEFVVDKTTKQSLVSITAPNQRGIDALRDFRNMDMWFDFDNPLVTERGMKLIRKKKPNAIATATADTTGGFADVADIESTLDQSLTADVIDKAQYRFTRLLDGVKGIAKRVGTKEGFPYVSLEGGDEDIEILSRNKDIPPLWKYIAAPLNLAIGSKIAPVIKIVEDLIDADIRRNMLTSSRSNEAKGVWASIPKSERNGEEFSKYMDEYYDPATIDADPEFADKSQEFRDALKWFKTREEIRRTEIIAIRRQAMRKILEADNSDEIVQKANDIGRVWSVERAPSGRKMIQTETALITIDEARDNLAKEMVPDTWGRQYAHMFHWFQGDLKLAAYKADGTKEIIGSAFTEPEAFQRLAMHKKDNPTAFVRWTAEPAVFINPDEAIALSAAQRNRLRKLLADATGAYSKDVSDAMRGIITTHSNKRPFYGALIERTGAKGFETDFMQVWNMSERLHNRWTMGGEMIRTVTPQIEELRKSYPAWAEYLTETMQSTLFTKPTVTEQVIDGMVNKMTLGLTSPFFTRKFLNAARALNYARQLFTVRQAAINSLQPLQTIYPIMGEANFAKAVAFYNTAEAKAILKKHGLFDAKGRFREGSDTGLGSDIYDFVSTINTGIQENTGINVSAESRNQNFSFVAMYWHATQNLGMSDAEAARYARIYGNVYTQFHYTKANMPYLLRGPIASTAFQYRRFAINSLGLLVNEFQRGNYSGAARYLGTLGIMGGFNALVGTSAIGIIYSLYRGDKEGADDMNFLLHKYLEDKLGSARAADVAIMGLPAAIGLDISGSISLLSKPFGRNIYEKIGATVAGPTINTIIQTATNLSAETAVEMGVGERAGRAIIDSSPSIQPLLTMMKMVNGDHAYQDAKGRKTYELDTADQWMKLLAFRTVSESNWSMEYQRLRIIRAEVDNASDKAATQLASGKRAEAMATLRKFNSMYPLAAITLADIKQRAENKKKSVTMSQLDRRVDLESSAKARKIAKSEGIGQ